MQPNNYLFFTILDQHTNSLINNSFAKPLSYSRAPTSSPDVFLPWYAPVPHIQCRTCTSSLPEHDDRCASLALLPSLGMSTVVRGRGAPLALSTQALVQFQLLWQCSWLCGKLHLCVSAQVQICEPDFERTRKNLWLGVRRFLVPREVTLEQKLPAACFGRVSPFACSPFVVKRLFVHC